MNGGFIEAIDKCTGKCNEHLTCEFLTPGFIDIHNHGMGGADDVAEFWKNPDHPLGSKMDSLLKILDSQVGCIDGEGAVLEGIHCEGPIITDLGAMPRGYNEMTCEEFEELLNKISNLKVMTISPHAEAAVSQSRIKCLGCSSCPWP